jgi:hypothetical protein
VCAIALTTDSVFWSRCATYPLLADAYEKNGAIRAVPKTGGHVVTIAADESASLGAIAVARDHVFWVDGASDLAQPSNDGSIRAAALDGGVPQTLVPAITPVPALVSDGQTLFSMFLDGPEQTGAIAATAGRIVAIDLADGGPTTVATSKALGSPTDDAQVLAFGSGYLWWVEQAPGNVMRAPFDGGTAQAVATEQEEPQALVVDDAAAFWVTSTTETTLNVVSTIDGGPSKLWTTANAYGGLSLALDSSFVYVANSARGTISKVDRASGKGTLIAGAQNEPVAIAVDDVAIYWANRGRNGNGGGGIMRLAK